MSSRPKKKQKLSKQETVQSEQWPQYFQTLYKVFKALNTVLAFIASRRQLATTFSVVRSSVENIIKQPLDLQKVAELKALLPEIIKFAYIPSHLHLVNPNASEPDFSIPAKLEDSEPEHVLVLEFAENWTGSAGDKDTSPLLPISRTPAATKKLVEKRNERFCHAVDELLHASDDPISILQTSARDCIPINPTNKSTPTLTSIPSPAFRPSIASVLSEIREQNWYTHQISGEHFFEQREAQFGVLEPPLSLSVAQAFDKITPLYTHQVDAIEAIRRGDNVVVSTSTASGKSVIYQAPLLSWLENSMDATAIFVYPTKALAQDQKIALEHFLGACPSLQHIRISTYDGDTPLEQRCDIREKSSVIFTNFDMIHASILPHEELWRRFLRNLKFFVVDELHYYSSLLGSHVAQIMRRFRRICAALGNPQPQFISCSATISNPHEHMKNIFGCDNITVITKDGSPMGAKEYVVWIPPPVDEIVCLGRRGPISEATRLMRFLMIRGVRVIMFCKYRKMCELAMKALREELTGEGRYDILERVRSYRGGYSSDDRRKFEQEAFSGYLLGLVATNALELGVDIGALDAVIMLGFPISLASFRQQAGRAGRRARDSLAVFVPTGDPLDQYYATHSEDLFDCPTDDLIVVLESSVLLESHLQCAAHEMPLCMQDENYFGPRMRELCERHLVKDQEGWYHPDPKLLPQPSRYISIRGAQEETYTLIDCSNTAAIRVLEEIEVSRALFVIYEGAVYIHQGITFIVNEVSRDTHTAQLVQVDVNWITKPRDFTDVNAVETHRIREIRDSSHRAYYGRVNVRSIVFGFYKIRNGKILESVDVETEPWERMGAGMWLDVPQSALSAMRMRGIKCAAGIHAAEHAYLNRFALGENMRTECKAPEKENLKQAESTRKRPARLIFYEQGEGGGVSAKAFDHVNEILRKALERIESCGCTEIQGCAKCVQSPFCSEKNEVSSKNGALVILKSILGIAVDLEGIPYEGQDMVGLDTIVDAHIVLARGNVEVENCI